MSKTERKQQAIEYMKMLDIYEPYIKEFEKNNTICLFEGFGGFYIDKSSDLGKQVREFEEKYNCTVYAVTHEVLEFGECYSLLIVTDYPEEWDDLVYTKDNKASAYAYVINSDCPDFSEFGDIAVQMFGGGIFRIA